MNREQIEDALNVVSEADPDVANVLRAYSDYRALMSEHPFDLRDRLLAYEEQVKDIARKIHELAIVFEKIGLMDD